MGTTTRDPPSPPGRSRPLSGFFCQESLQSMLSLKEPRLSPSTPHPSKSLLGKYSKKAFIKANTYLKNNDYFIYVHKTHTHIYIYTLGSRLFDIHWFKTF